MTHDSLFYQFPSGIHMHQGKQSFANGIRIFSPAEQLRIGLDPAINFATLSVNNAAQLAISQAGGNAKLLLSSTAATLIFGPFSFVASGGGLATNALFTSNGDFVCRGSLTITGAVSTGPILTGIAATSNASYLFGSGTALVAALATTNVAVNTSGNVSFTSFMVGAKPIVITTGATPVPIIASAVFMPNAITETSTTCTDAPTVYIKAAPTGSTGNKYAFWSDSGANRLDDVTSIGTNAAPPTTAFLTIGAATTGIASLRILSGTAPTSPTDGDMWYDGTNVKFRVGGTTKTFTLT